MFFTEEVLIWNKNSLLKWFVVVFLSYKKSLSPAAIKALNLQNRLDKFYLQDSFYSEEPLGVSIKMGIYKGDRAHTQK